MLNSGAFVNKSDLLEWVRRMPTHCMMADLGMSRRKPMGEPDGE